MQFRLPLFLIALAAILPAQPDRFANPACSAPDQELANRTYFVLCHSSSLKVPVWVGYELTPQNLVHNAARPSHFRHDYDLTQPSAFDADYRNSGFTRGHLAPVADFAFSDAAIQSTFVLSNAAPQYASPNSGRWAQLEKAVRQLAANAEIWVYAGPIFEGSEIQTIGPHHVAVPTHFFKVVLVVEENRKTMYAAIIPNQPQVKTPLNSFNTTVHEVERRTSLDFFSALEDEEENRLESHLEISPERSNAARYATVKKDRARVSINKQEP